MLGCDGFTEAGWLLGLMVDEDALGARGLGYERFGAGHGWIDWFSSFGGTYTRVVGVGID